MKRIGSILFLFGALLFTGCREKGSNAIDCDEVTSRLVAKAYGLSNPIMGQENELISLMRSNPGYFTEDGRAIQCMKSLGTALVQGGLAQSEQFSGSSAIEQFGSSMPPGLEDLPRQVDDSLRSDGGDRFTMGQEFLWLSQVLPSAVRGNYVPYKTTGTKIRQRAVQARPMCQMYPEVCEMMRSKMMPVLEEQVYTYARQLSN